MDNQKRIRWRFGALAALGVVLITLIPQTCLWIVRGREWQGAYAFTDPDELAYSAYLNSLIVGRPRLNNPYLGLNDSAQTASETLFSVQFLSPYLLVPIARMLGVSASTVFILLIPIASFLSSLAIFWLLAEVTGEDRLAATGVLIVLLCGLLVSESPFAATQSYGSFAFLRRYIPALPFPFFFLFCLFVWRALSSTSKRSLLWALAAGITFSFLVYSYFYLWTAAGAWILCFTVFWAAANRNDRRHLAKCVVVFGSLAIMALIPYFKMLQERSKSVDTRHLELTHMPDLFRFVELIGGFLLVALVWNIWRGNISWRCRRVIFAASCCVAPLIVFNQQIITGRSLQPFHYEQFVINYLLLVGAVITYRLIWWHVRIRPVLWIGVAVTVGIATGFKSALANLDLNIARDEAVVALERIDEIQARDTAKGVVFLDRPWLAASAPTHATAHILWSPYSYTYGTSPTVEMERFYQYLYYKGTDVSAFQSALRSEPLYRGVVFGLHRENLKLSRRGQPISEEEVLLEAKRYKTYIDSFSQQQADSWPLSLVLVTNVKSHDFSNLDRWYVRDSGERVGKEMLYRVHRR